MPNATGSSDLRPKQSNSALTGDSPSGERESAVSIHQVPVVPSSLHQECLRCGYEWKLRYGHKLPRMCPFCRSTVWRLPPEYSERCPITTDHDRAAVRHDSTGRFFCIEGHSWPAHRRTSYPEHPKWKADGDRNDARVRSARHFRKILPHIIDILGDEVIDFLPHGMVSKIRKKPDTSHPTQPAPLVPPPPQLRSPREAEQ